MRKITLLHGWKVRNAKKSVGVLADPLRDLGHDVDVISYGYLLWPAQTALRSRQVSKMLSTIVEPETLVVAHSNGAYVAWELSYHSDVPLRMVWVNPALDRHLTPGSSVDYCLLFHNRHDWAVWLAKWIPGINWGDAGRLGYKPLPEWKKDERVINKEFGRGHHPFRGNPLKMARMIHSFSKSDDLASLFSDED